MALKGYHSYRGRQGIWRWLLAIVLVLVLIAACAFLLLQRYIVYSDDGSFYLDLPFELNWNIPLLNGGESAGEEQKEPQQDVNLVVDPSEEEQPGQGEPDTPNPEPEPEPEIEPPVTEMYIPRRLVDLNQLLVSSSTLTETLNAAGADGFVFLAKNKQGYLLYQSTIADSGAVYADGLSREMLTQLCAQEGVYTVARINCMRDSFYAASHPADAGVCKSNGGIWYEHDAQSTTTPLPAYDRGGHWLDAEKEAARSYLISIAIECAQLGFDELMLENVFYPYRGNLYKIDYSKNTMSKTDALVLFLEELEAALEPYGVNISLVLDKNIVLGLAENTEDTGFIPQSLLPLVDAVYVSTVDPTALQQEIENLLNGERVPALIPIVNEAVAEGGWYIAG